MQLLYKRVGGMKDCLFTYLMALVDLSKLFFGYKYSVKQLRPCDFKMGKVLNSIRTFKTSYNFDIRLPICREGLLDGKILNDILQDGISFHAKELRGAKALVAGNLVDVIGDEPCTSDDGHEVELLLPLMNDASLGGRYYHELEK